MIELLNIDCIHYMRLLPDNAFDLAIVDPPYGIGQNWKKDRKSKFYKHDSSYHNNSIPDNEYFEQLFRVSANQIIWGANYYTRNIPPRNSWIVWDKVRSFKNTHMSECELAWHSFNVPCRIYKNQWNGFVRSEKNPRIHPHEKPTALYKFLLTEFAKPGDRILDTHGGSMSIAIACYDLGFDLVCTEKDPIYYKNAVNRYNRHKFQTIDFNNLK